MTATAIMAGLMLFIGGVNAALYIGGESSTPAAFCRQETYVVTNQHGAEYPIESCHTLTGPWLCLIHADYGDYAAKDVTPQVRAAFRGRVGPACAA